jgi:hypothetical protein
VAIVKKIGIFLWAFLLIQGCRKSSSASWDVDVVLPVVTSELNIKNFFGDSIFKADNAGQLSLAVTRTITAIKLDSLIRLPDTTIVTNFTIPAISYTLAPNSSFPLLPSGNITFSISNNASLKTVAIHQGFLKVKFTNTTRQPLQFIYTVPNAVKNGSLFTISEIIPGFTYSTSPMTRTYDMSGYYFNMKTGALYNTIAQVYDVKNAGSVVDTVLYGSGITTEISYSNIVPEYIDGYFGQHDIAIPLDTAKIDIIKSFEASNFLLNDASFLFRILNEFGCEFTSNFTNVKSINKNSVVALNTNQLSNLNINASTRAGNTIFPSAKTVSFTSGNSNIVPFLSNLPDKLSYQGNINVNPLGNISGYNNFAYYNTGIKVLADIEIPLRFNADYFKLISNTKIDFANVTQLDNVNYGEFVISAKNGYPFSARLQAYLVDKNNNVIDSLFITGANTVASGKLDNQNIVTEEVSSKLRVPLDKKKVENLKNSSEIRIETYFIMPPNPPDIKLYESYKIDVNIVAELNYKAQRK